MKKITVLVLFYFGLFSLSILLHSCCNDPENITIVGGGDINFLQSVEFPTTGSTFTDTLTDMRFTMFANYELEFAAHFMDLGLLNSAYGLSCEPNYINDVVSESLMVNCNMDFTFDGMTIAAGTDFSQLDGVSSSIGNEDAIVFITQEFMDKADFVNGPTTFTVLLRTTDNIELISEGTVEIDL